MADVKKRADGRDWPYDESLAADGVTWNYFSPSTLMSADSGTAEGCLRKAWFEKKKKLKGEEKDWQTLGREIHKEFEDYLTTGVVKFMPMAAPLLPMLPKPKTVDSRILLEHEIGGGLLATAPLRVRGIPIVGYIDCYSWQDDDHLVLDFKTTSNAQWIKGDADVSRTLQMTTYGKWVVDTRGAETVRLEHGYIVTKGPKLAKRVGLRVHRDQINQRWEYVDKLAGSLIEAVKEENADRVPANTRACGAFRGCDHRAYCSAANHNSLASLISQSKNTVTKLSQIKVTPKETMGVLDQLKANLANKAAGTDTKTPAPETKVAPAGVTKESEMARLALEEVNTRYPRVKQAIADLAAMGVGRPQLSGEAARVYALLDGTPLTPGAGLPPLGKDLKGVHITDPDGIEKLVAELKSVPAVVDPFPDDAPVELAKPADPELKPITTAAEALAEGLEPKKKKSKKKDVVEKAIEQITAGVQTPTSLVQERFEPMTASTQIFLYVDCIPSVPTRSLWTIVNDITKQLAESQGGTDYRTLDPNGPAGYGRHHGMIAAALRQAFVEGEITGGHWLLDGARNSQLGTTIVEAMREIVAHTNGVIVRGIL